MNDTELRQRRPIRPQVVTDEATARNVKDRSTYSGKVFLVTFLALSLLVLLPLLAAIFILECPIEPQYLSFQEPPLLSGVLEPNLKLRKAERLFEGQLVGPESIANIGDVLYTGTADGQIVKIEDGKSHTVARLGRPPCGTRELEPTCGRPLGIRVGPNGTLFVIDSYLGLFEVNPVTGDAQILVYPGNPIQGRKLSFVNDLTITQDGKKIYFTDSSSKWQRKDFTFLVLEGRDDGRLLEYDTVTREVKVLLDGLRFPNGVQLSPAEDFVLVAETTMARIRSYTEHSRLHDTLKERSSCNYFFLWLHPLVDGRNPFFLDWSNMTKGKKIIRYYVSGLRKGGADMFLENMPGFPDNIRPSSSGGYWVAMSAVRQNPGFSMVDFLAQRPWLRELIFKLFSQETVMKLVPKYSLVLELSDDGIYMRSLHDPNGEVVTYVSEAHEYDGHLYLGSFRSPFLCKLKLQDV